MFGCNVEDIARLAIDGHIGEVKGFGVNFAVDGVEADLTELSGVYVALRKDGFLCVESVARDVVVIGGHVWRTGCRRGLYGQGERGGVSEVAGGSGECDC